MEIETLRKTGLKHKRTFQPCQDSSMSELVNGQVIAAVADGHGNSLHYLSETGSHLACESAIEILHSVSPKACNDALHRRRLSNHIAARWRDKVIADFSERCNPQINKASENHILSIYGTTLIWIIADNDYILAGQIGDGTVAALGKDGSIFLPLGEPVCSDITDSLCSGNAGDLFRTVSIPSDGIQDIIICTDGLINHFSDIESFYSFIKDILTSEEPTLPDTFDDSAIAILRLSL